MDPNPRSPPAGLTVGCSRCNRDRNANICRHRRGHARAIRDPPGPAASGIRMDTETPDHVRASLAQWEAGQKLGEDYFEAKERMSKKIEAMTACLSLEPQPTDPVQQGYGHPATNFGEGAGGGPVPLDTLNSMNDYGYSLRNYIAVDPVSDSNPPPGGPPVGEVYAWPEYVHQVPPASGLQTRGTWRQLERGGGVEEGYRARGWEEASDTPSRR